jgi:hypothetical protein
MTPTINLQTATETAADPIMPTNEDRPLSFGAAFVGFVLSTAVTSTVMMLLSQF